MSTHPNDSALVQELADSSAAIKQQLAKRIIGQQSIIDDLLACFLAGGHCLLIGVPGLAKTTLIQSLAQTLDLAFNRIQFTPDLMPSDITGSEILFEDRASGVREFRFSKGPLFTNLLLADEINRTPPKTQSALLQAMQENEVTSAGQTWRLPSPFWVLATQNPIEQEGTYPLPEAQQDRFMYALQMEYPDAQSEFEIARTTTSPSNQKIDAVVSLEQIRRFKELVWRIPVTDSVVRYAVTLTRATRPSHQECPDTIKRYLTWGAGPRAAQFLLLSAKAHAALDKRPTPDVEDVKRAALAVLRHRLVRSFHAEVENISTTEIIQQLLKGI